MSNLTPIPGGADPRQDPYLCQETTVWSFPDRGKWASHRGDYRGNWSPHVPRNLILKYSKAGDLVLDPMMGSGTTLVECKLLGRRGLGVDVNPAALALAHENLQATPMQAGPVEIRLERGDARSMTNVRDGEVDLIATHPPYASIIQYSGGAIDADLSSIHRLEDFFAAIGAVARECWRVLKPGGHCAILMGDTRKKGHFVPLTARLLCEFLSHGFLLRENIIKLQWNTTSERGFWKTAPRNFFMIAHEQLYVFRKPTSADDARDHALSGRW